jgi:hypothetical protein
MAKVANAAISIGRSWFTMAKINQEMSKNFQERLLDANDNHQSLFVYGTGRSWAMS